ncbi:hypothetical protein F5B20DRAFT_281965 [Whalleya microplaca]|nr:hypothetical protein F5B20DRAFT_281965 [Whalleya microplaca]
MYFTKIAFVLSLAVSALAMPTNGIYRKQKRALTFRPYSEFQVSSGTAGNALAEVQAQFPINGTSLANVSDADLAILKAARETAEAAETDAFNPAIDGNDSDALQNGKIKNKVLKLYLETMALQIEQAQGADNQAKIDAEQKKLDTNVATDKKAAGQASQSVDFTGDVQPSQ